MMHSVDRLPSRVQTVRKDPDVWASRRVKRHHLVSGWRQVLLRLQGDLTPA
jgi:hypothetical protein